MSKPHHVQTTRRGLAHGELDLKDRDENKHK